MNEPIKWLVNYINENGEEVEKVGTKLQLRNFR